MINQKSRELNRILHVIGDIVKKVSNQVEKKRPPSIPTVLIYWPS